MASIREVGRAVRSSRASELARAVARTPLEHEASRLIAGLPVAELVDLTGEASFSASIGALAGRHAWSLGTAEQLVLQALIATRPIANVFEIGTFNGATARLIAEALPDEGKVVTLDLPPRDFDATQSPQGFGGGDVGRAYADSPAAGKITQLLADSLTFDPAPYAGGFDLVLVDGGHEYSHGLADSRTALQLLAPGGLILWDDFAPYWHGLVRGICQAMQGRRLSRLAGTSFAVFSDDAASPR